jgi:hypothetical protein
MKLGAHHYITRPVNADALRLVVSRALEHVRLCEEVRSLRSSLDQKYGFENIISRSSALLYILDTAGAGGPVGCYHADPLGNGDRQGTAGQGNSLQQRGDARSLHFRPRSAF